jgi:uncharacterized protein DUF5047
MYDGMSASATSRINESHGIAARITVTSPGVGQLTLPISDGSAVFDATNQVRRTASITVDPKYWPKSPLDLLSPYGSKGKIEYGIELRNGRVEWVPMGIYYLDSDQRQRPASANGGMTVALSDRTTRIQADGPTSPLQTIAGATCVSEIMRLIQLTDPTIVVTDLTGSLAIAQPIVISQDRWGEGIAVLAEAIGAEVITDLNDGFIIRPQPTVDGTQPVYTLRRTTMRGAENISAITDNIDTTQVKNVWVITGTKADGTAAFTTVVEDDDPNSPTYVDGPFGRRTEYYSSATLANVAQGQIAGQAFLARSKSFAVVPTFTTLPNPALDAGDVLLYQDGDDSAGYPILLSKVTTPFSLSQLQELDITTFTLPDSSGTGG